YEAATNGSPTQILLSDLQSGLIELISINTSGAPGNGASTTPLLSWDGRYVVFMSKASNLVSNDFNGVSDIFIRDRWKSTTTLLSLNYVGTASANGPSSRPVLSADGHTVAFQSFANDL